MWGSIAVLQGSHTGAHGRLMMVAMEARGGNINRPVKITITLEKAETSEQPFKTPPSPCNKFPFVMLESHLLCVTGVSFTFLLILEKGMLGQIPLVVHRGVKEEVC